MTSYASPWRRPAPRRPLEGLVAGAVALLVAIWISTLGARIQRNPSVLIRSVVRGGPAQVEERERPLRAFSAEIHLSSAEERDLRAAVAEARETRRAAIAYFETPYEAQASCAPVAATALDELVEDVLQARLAAILQPAHLQLATRHLALLRAAIADGP